MVCFRALVIPVSQIFFWDAQPPALTYPGTPYWVVLSNVSRLGKYDLLRKRSRMMVGFIRGVRMPPRMVLAARPTYPSPCWHHRAPFQTIYSSSDVMPQRVSSEYTRFSYSRNINPFLPVSSPPIARPSRPVPLKLVYIMHQIVQEGFCLAIFIELPWQYAGGDLRSRMDQSLSDYAGSAQRCTRQGPGRLVDRTFCSHSWPARH